MSNDFFLLCFQKKSMHVAKLEFPVGWGLQTKKPPMGMYGYFLELHIANSHPLRLHRLLPPGPPRPPCLPPRPPPRPRFPPLPPLHFLLSMYTF